MKTTIDAAGRLVIPSEVRREAKLTPGTTLDVRWRNGHIEIELAPVPVSLERRGKLLVAVPEKKLPVLTPQTVEHLRQTLIDDRSVTK